MRMMTWLLCGSTARASFDTCREALGYLETPRKDWTSEDLRGKGTDSGREANQKLKRERCMVKKGVSGEWQM